MDTEVRGQHFDNLCRTCMHELVEEFSYTGNNKPEQQWRSIMDQIQEIESLPIAELLSVTIPQIQVHFSDDLPKKICCKCLEQVQSIFQFQQMCQQSDQHLRKLIAKGNAETNVAITIGALSLEIKVEELSPQEYFLEVKDQGIDIKADSILPATAHSSAVAAADPLQSSDAQADIGIDETHESSNDHESNVKFNEDKVPLTELPSQEDVLTTLTAEEQDIESSSTNDCSICNKSFKGIRPLKAHLRCHKKSANTEFPTYTCEICNKTYNAKSSLMRHKNIRHSTVKPKKPKRGSAENPKKPEPTRQICKICDKTFVSPYTLRQHLSTHTSERAFLCPECGKSFTKEIYLKNHVLRHNDVMAFECPHCPKKFRTSSAVYKHKLIHQEIKKHVCDICGVRFVKTQGLAVHKRTHNSVKSFQCDFCDKRFVSKYNYRLHMRTHTGEKPYKCQYCERTFAQSGDHIKHLRTHIGDNVYRCEMCPSAYRLASELRVHFATHKNEDAETRERNMKALKEEEAKLQLKLVEQKKDGTIKRKRSAEKIRH